MSVLLFRYTDQEVHCRRPHRAQSFDEVFTRVYEWIFQHADHFTSSALFKVGQGLLSQLLGISNIQTYQQNIIIKVFLTLQKLLIIVVHGNIVTFYFIILVIEGSKF